MKVFLDANVLTDIANETADAPRIHRRLEAVGVRSCALSAITIEELHFGVLSGPSVKKAYQIRNLKAMIAAFRRIDFTSDAARAAAAVRLQLKSVPQRRGKKRPGPLDLLLAGHAIAEHRTVVTADDGFNSLTGVRVENWRE